MSGNDYHMGDDPVKNDIDLSPMARVRRMASGFGIVFGIAALIMVVFYLNYELRKQIVKDAIREVAKEAP